MKITVINGTEKRGVTYNLKEIFLGELRDRAEITEFYLPKERPEIVTVPRANYAAVRGQGDPNAPDGAYQRAIAVLYAVAYTIKMSKKGDHRIDGYYDFVVPPLEGFWWQDEIDGVDYGNKAGFQWYAVIRLPDFVTGADFAWAVAEAGRKKRLDCSGAEFLTVDEGLCVQILHVGPFDDEPRSVALMDEHIRQQGYENDFSATRLHHEIYLSDARKAAPEKWRTVIRHPIRKSDRRHP